MGGFIGPLLAGVGALGGLFPGRQGNTSNVNNTTTSTPNYDPTNQAFRDKLIAMYGNLLNGAGPGSDFENSFRTAGLRNLNRTSNVAQGAISDLLTSRGIGRTTAGGIAEGGAALNNAGRTADFLNNVPLLMDQRFQDILRGASGYQSSLPFGNTQHQQGTVANMGGPQGGFSGAIGGLAGSLGPYLGILSAQNSFQKTLKSYYPSAGSTGPMDMSGGGWG